MAPQVFWCFRADGSGVNLPLQTQQCRRASPRRFSPIPRRSTTGPFPQLPPSRSRLRLDLTRHITLGLDLPVRVPLRFPETDICAPLLACPAMLLTRSRAAPAKGIPSSDSSNRWRRDRMRTEAITRIGRLATRRPLDGRKPVRWVGLLRDQKHGLYIRH